MNISRIKDTKVFRGMSEEEVLTAFDKLHAIAKNYKKETTILHAGSTTDRMGLVLEGSVTIEIYDGWGNKTILSHVGENQVFAETYGLLSDSPMLVDVVANEDCRILFLRIGLLRRGFAKQAPWTFKLISNLLAISAYKNLALLERSFHTAGKSFSVFPARQN